MFGPRERKPHVDDVTPCVNSTQEEEQGSVESRSDAGRPEDDPLLSWHRMRLSIPAKVFSGFAVILVTFALVTGFSVYQMHGIGTGLALVSRSYHPLTRISAQLQSSYGESEKATARLLDETETRTRRWLLRYALEYYPVAAREKITAGQAVLLDARLSPSARDEAPFLDRLDGLLATVALRYGEYAQAGQRVMRQLDKLEVAIAQGSADRKAVELEFDDSVRHLKRVEQGIGTSLKEFADELDERIDQRVRQAGKEEQQSLLLIVALSLLAVGVGIFITVAAQRILAPIRRLTEAVKDIGEGQFTREIAVVANDELAILAREFNAMARKLLERERQLSEKTAELVRAERLAAVGRLAAQITHEIRNPLSSISLNAELLQEQLEAGHDVSDTKSEARALVKSMAREVDRLTEITEEYLRFARLPKPDLTSVDLNDALDDLLDFMNAELAASSVEARREWALEAPLVRADAGQLRQVILNLVRNAREAVGSGGHLHLRTSVDKLRRVAVVEVEDDGPGIPDALRAHLFEPFFSTKEGGTGLGLAVVQQVIHEHGGEVECTAGRERGTKFVITLPLAPDALAAPASEGDALLPLAAGR